MSKTRSENSNVSNAGNNQKQGKIIHLNGERFKPACAAPIDIEMLNECLDAYMLEFRCKKTLAGVTAELVGKLLSKAGLDPAAFIIEDTSISDYIEISAFNMEDIISGCDDYENGNGKDGSSDSSIITVADSGNKDSADSIDSIDNTDSVAGAAQEGFPGLCFIMAGENGYDYRVETVYFTKADGNMEIKAILLRDDGKTAEAFLPEKEEWEPAERVIEDFQPKNKEIAEIIKNSDDDGATADYVETCLDYAENADADSVKKAVEKDRELILLYRETKDYMDIEWINAKNDDLEETTGIPRFGLVPRDPMRMGIAAMFLDGKFRILAHVEDGLLAEYADGEAETFDYIKGMVAFDTERKAAEYLFMTCNRFAQEPVYTLPLSGHSFVDIKEGKNGEAVVCYINTYGKPVTEQEKRTIEELCEVLEDASYSW